MEDGLKKKKIEKAFIIIAVCVATIGCLVGIGTVSYNYFYNKESVQALVAQQENNEDTSKISNSIDNNEEQETQLEEKLEEAEEQDQEEIIEISEEERKKKEEEEKKQEEEQKKKQEEEEKKHAINYQYLLKVNYTANTVTAYKKDENGNYTVPVKAMVCSTGAATPTSGVYKTQNKYRWKLLIGNSYGQYSTRITGQILFHSVPYEKQTPDSIITKYYDRLGITTSLGCIRLTVADAKWIYDNCPLGTSVEFYSSSNPGPLGKPSAVKIADAGYPLNRWDPTDPDSNNPWKNKVAEKTEEKVENTVDAGTNTSTENNQNSETNNQNNAQENNQNNNSNNTQNNNQNSDQNNNQNNGQNGNQNNSQNSNPNNAQSSNNNKNDGQKDDSQKTNEDKDTNIKVPNVIGKSEKEAISLLNNLLVTIEYKSDSSNQNGIVLYQSLQPGSNVAKRTKIVLYINKIQDSNSSKDESKDKDNIQDKKEEGKENIDKTTNIEKK